MAAPPRFEHGFVAPQATVISRLHYRAQTSDLHSPFKHDGLVNYPGKLEPSLAFC
jgi:hypothetical protein